MSMEHWWNDSDRGKPNDSEKNLSHFHSLHAQDWKWTRASTVRGRRLTSWDMVRVHQLVDAVYRNSLCLLGKS